MREQNFAASRLRVNQTAREGRGRAWPVLLCVLLLLPACRPPVDASSTSWAGAEDPQAAYAAALRGYEQEESPSFEAAFLLARQATRLLDLRFDRLSRDEHLAIVREGLKAASQAASIQPERAAGHYYLAALTGLKARSTGLLGKRTVARIESYCEEADRRDPAFDAAGASRLLGILFRKVPGRRQNLKRSRELLEQAVRLAPGSALNHLELALTLAAFGETEAAREEFSRYEKLKKGGERTPFVVSEEAAARKALR